MNSMDHQSDRHAIAQSQHVEALCPYPASRDDSKAPSQAPRYRLTKSAPAPTGIDEDARGYHVEVRWGSDTLFSRTLPLGEPFHVDPRLDGGSACFLLPEALFKGPAMLLVDDGRVFPIGRASSGSRASVQLEGDAKLEQHLGSFTVSVRAVHLARRIDKGGRHSSGWTWALAGSLMLHVLMGLTLSVIVSPLAMQDDDTLTSDDRQLIAYFLQTDAEQSPPQSDPSDTAADVGKNPPSASADHGAAITRDQDNKNRTSRRTPSPHFRDHGGRRGFHLSRNDGLAFAENFGMVELVRSSRGIDNAPHGFGLFASSPRSSCEGSEGMWDEQLGTYGISGLSLSGIGEGGPRSNVIALGRLTGLGGPLGMAGSHRFNTTRCPQCSAERGTRVPRLRSAGLARSGALPASVIQRIVRNNFGRFRHCYQRALAQNPSLGGRVVVRFVIGRQGMVSGSSASGDLPDPSVHACVASAAAGLSFPAPERGVVTVQYPLVFSSTG